MAVFPLNFLHLHHTLKTLRSLSQTTSMLYLQLPTTHLPVMRVLLDHGLQPPLKRAQVNDEEEIEPGGLPRDPFFQFPGAAYSAGQTYGSGPNLFEAIAEARRKEGISDQNPWSPFESKEEWDFVRWAMESGISQGDIDKYLKLEMTRTRTGLSFKNKRSFFAKIDSLPKGPKWQCEIWEVKGTEVDENQNLKTEVVELWKRDPVECIRDLLANPVFAKHMRYEPERLYEDEAGKRPIFNEMWTGEWWEKLQKLLPNGATVVPVILASDKTQLSTFSGDKSAWPVYLSIGNISKDLRRSPSARATVLVGYLPVSKLECFPKAERSAKIHELFHQCMTSLLEPLVEAGRNGVEMVCADGSVHRMYPIVAAYIADHPEQCLVACTKESVCPKCQISPDHRGETHHSPFRDPAQTKSWIDDALHGWPRAAKNANIRSVKPFWANLPHCDIFLALTPDILHQLHKGMFKDHLVKWTTACVEGKESEIDRRYQTMTAHPDLRYFKCGISLVSQWTGTEYKHMEKVFLGVVAGSADRRVERAVRAVLDFIHYAHFETHNEDSLSRLEASWRAFHDTKSVFLELGVPDGYNTESPERLHIDFAKIAYRASNKKDYIKQMTKWLERQDSMQRFQAYLDFRHPISQPESGNESNSDDEDCHPEGVEEGDEDEESRAEYQISKRAPFPRMSIETIENDMRAVDFKRCLVNFLRERGLHAIQAGATVDEPGLKKSSVDIVRAIPPLRAQGRRQAVPAQFSTVLAFETSGNHAETSRTGVVNPISGLTVGEVHLIFNVPRKYEAVSKDPLAYIEWFTSLDVRNHNIGMFSISRSTRNHRRLFGTVMDKTWTRDNVAQRSQKFYVNPYLRHSDFVLLRLLVDKWLESKDKAGVERDSGPRLTAICS
ncbi:hypothetical protein BC835DRAFT_1306895 [Cytidiella melzeri]|nr:hypothetical protein BC835DRAFT_1306895 [Cytidiella melzeri]